MTNELNSTENDANDESSWDAPLSDKQISDSINTKLSKHESENHENDDRLSMTIARGEIQGLVADEVNRIYMVSTQVQLRNEIGKTLVGML